MKKLLLMIRIIYYVVISKCTDLVIAGTRVPFSKVLTVLRLIKELFSVIHEILKFF